MKSIMRIEYGICGIVLIALAVFATDRLFGTATAEAATVERFMLEGGRPQAALMVNRHTGELRIGRTSSPATTMLAVRFKDGETEKVPARSGVFYRARIGQPVAVRYTAGLITGTRYGLRTGR